MHLEARTQCLQFRQRHDGRLELYCRSCSTVVGSAEDLNGVFQSRHYRCKCRETHPNSDKPLFYRWLYTGAHDPRFQRIHVGRQILLLTIALGLLYILPTLLEISVLGAWDPWLTVVALGDLAGCVCLALVFRKPRLAIDLYLATSLVEVWLHHFHLIPDSVLPLLADFAPTVIVLAFIWVCPSQLPAEAERAS